MTCYSKLLILAIVWQTAMLQTSLPAQQAQEGDSTKTTNVIGGMYDRPYIDQLGGNIAIGGYFEMNSNFVRENGLEEGLSFEARRFNLFVFSPISDYVKLTSELEFEHGTEEIALETAIVDVLFSLGLNLRAGVLLSPIGKFNIAHDSPRYDIIDRPLVSTQIIPSTLSEVGFGFFGALYATPFDRITYELYAVNGLGAGIIGGTGEGTRIAAGKSEEAFEEDNNGSPAFTGRLALNPRFGGEFGLSFHTGAFNSYKIEGDLVDDKRRLTILALDAEYRWHKLKFRGEAALANIDVQESLSELFAEKQQGYYLELGYNLLQGRIKRFEDASLALVTRFDYVDMNVGTFRSTGQNIADLSRRITVGLSFRPSTETSIRLSYGRTWDDDPVNNRGDMMNLQFGIATYF